MKRKVFWSGFIVFLTLVFSCFSLAASYRGVERMGSGAYWPLGFESSPSGKGGWLYGTPGKPSYVNTSQYHLAVDHLAPENSPVFAIANGEILQISDTGWGDGNVCAIVKHYTANGDPFVAFYGHIRLFPGYSEGSAVWGGLPFARLGPYYVLVNGVNCPPSSRQEKRKNKVGELLKLIIEINLSWSFVV